MFRNTSLEVSDWTSFLRVSTPAPRLPMTMPGRAVKMLILTLLAARSTSTEATPACPSFCLTNLFRRTSSCSHLGYSFSEYHFEVQPRMTPRRNPIGCVFCPIASLLLGIHGDGDVRAAAVDPVGATHRPGQPALLDGAGVDGHRGDHQLVRVRLLVLRRVGDGRGQHLAEHAGRLAGLELEDG